MTSSRNHIAHIDNEAVLLVQFLDRKVLPVLEEVHEYHQRDSSLPLSNSDKKGVVDLLHTVAIKLDSLWSQLTPELDIQLIVPKNVPEPHEPPATLVMSRLASDEERDTTMLACSAAKDAEASVLSEAELGTLQSLHEQYRLDLFENLEFLKQGGFGEQRVREENIRNKELSMARRKLDEAKDAARRSQMKVI